MLDSLPEDIRVALKIFRQEDLEKYAVMQGGRFVHYTSVEAAVSILQRKEAWLRNSTVQNDFSEIEYGKYCSERALASESGKQLREIARALSSTLWNRVTAQMAEISDLLNSRAYIACLSEHDPKEDSTGRLSMWRAYGDIAIVLNTAAFMTVSDVLGVYSSPVHYRSPADFCISFDRMVQRVDESRSFLATLEEDTLVWHFVQFFISSILCTKHPGFAEEREWRVFHVPGWRFGSSNSKVIEEVRVVRGIAQKIYKVPLQDYPEEGFFSASLPALIERVIIGPTEYPWVMYDAFVDLLKGAGVANAESRVVVSEIPLRKS